MKLTLYHYWRSSSSWRVRWALAHKGIAAKYIPVSLLDGEAESPTHRTRTPLGYVPALAIEIEGTTRFLTQSLAICHWLDEQFPQAPSILGGKDPWLRAKVRELAEIINADTQPLQNLGVQELHSSDATEKKLWAQHWIRNGLAAYETLARSSSGIYSVGDAVSIADFCLIPQLYNARRYDLPVENLFPTLARIELAAKDTPSYSASEPARFEPKEG